MIRSIFLGKSRETYGRFRNYRSEQGETSRKFCTVPDKKLPGGLTGPDFVILTGKLSRNGKGYDWLILVTAVQ